MGGDLYPRGREFESQYHTLDGSSFTIICCKNDIFKNNISPKLSIFLKKHVKPFQILAKTTFAIFGNFFTHWATFTQTFWSPWREKACMRVLMGEFVV